MGRGDDRIGERLCFADGTNSTVVMTTMERRKLGDLDVSAVCLGCMSMTPIYGVPDPGEAMATLHRAPDIGIEFIDTSDAYGANGANEELVGRALKGRRQKYILATKFGNIRLADGKPSAIGKPEYVMQACELSLKRLGTDHIDLYCIHRVDETVPIEDTVGAMVRLKELGKIRRLGISEAGPVTIRRAHKVHPMAALQTEYSLWTRDVEGGLLSLCQELGIGFVAYAPLGRGFLTGTVPAGDGLPQNDFRRNMPRFQGDNARHNEKLLDLMRQLAAKETCTPAQLAIAWVLSRRPPVVALAGSSKRKWLEENAKASELKLSAATLNALDAAFKPGIALGDRYPSPMMARLGL
jgi:aryl-alcohol dehydrogenase-like predicted oxidoreductase